MKTQYQRKIIEITEDTIPLLGDIIINEKRTIKYLVLGIDKNEYIQKPWDSAFGTQSRNEKKANIRVSVFNGKYFNDYNFSDMFIGTRGYCIFRQSPNFAKDWIKMIK